MQSLHVQFGTRFSVAVTYFNCRKSSRDYPIPIQVVQAVGDADRQKQRARNYVVCLWAAGLDPLRIKELPVDHVVYELTRRNVKMHSDAASRMCRGYAQNTYTAALHPEVDRLRELMIEATSPSLNTKRNISHI